MEGFNFNIDSYLRLNIWDVIIVSISTFLIVWIAKHFFWDKVIAYLDGRTAAIQEDIDAGIKEREAGEQYRKQYEEQLSNAKQEAQAIVEQAKSVAADEKQNILAEAKAEALRLKEKAQRDMEREKLQAREEMKDSIVDVAFEAAKSIVEKEMDAKTHKKFVNELIERAGDETWQ